MRECITMCLQVDAAYLLVQPHVVAVHFGPQSTWPVIQRNQHTELFVHRSRRCRWWNFRAAVAEAGAVALTTGTAYFGSKSARARTVPSAVPTRQHSHSRPQCVIAPTNASSKSSRWMAHSQGHDEHRKQQKFCRDLFGHFPNLCVFSSRCHCLAACIHNPEL